MAAVSGIGENASDVASDGPLHVGDDGRQGVAVIGFPGSALAWSANCPPLERCSVVAIEIFTSNS